MFSLEQYCDDEEQLVLEILCNDPPQDLQESKISQDSIASLETSHQLNIIDNNNPKKKRRVGLASKSSDRKVTAADDDDGDDSFKLKKIKHRDMERQRRRGMATLYSSLRSLLPLQYVKGKRSVSDHMHEAVSYIKQLQTNMKELEERRDKLKLLPSNSTTSSPTVKESKGGSSDSSSVISPDCVTVSPCHGGVEILINTRGHSLSLPKVLGVLLKEGLDVVSCCSSQANQNSLHRIQSQASDMECINLHALERKVIEVINND